MAYGVDRYGDGELGEELVADGRPGPSSSPPASSSTAAAPPRDHTRRNAGEQRAAAAATAVQTLTDALATGSTVPTAAELAAREGISTRTAHRRITAARQRLHTTEGQETTD
ncbi:hypothetical protein ACIGQE_18535 [Streptomyces sp. NPDC053429]|uniref:hypothetical protein n=1 Tax=Streptomyces sp. NPDC053429 TaxID=3365702 RepID=UPI0037CF93E6